MFSSNWSQRKKSYDVVVVGSGYGGAITAARIATANLAPKPSVCVLERGKEWWPGNNPFPDTLRDVTNEFHGPLNPRGLYELTTYRDISVMKGCGLGGTSLINANVAATPDPEVFDRGDWPNTLRWEGIRPYYDRARATLGAGPDPRAWDFPKVHAMDRRAREIGMRAKPLDLAINFTKKGKNDHGVPCNPCLACGDCTTGCNHLSKNALYMNYLPMARNAGADIFTHAKVEWIEKVPAGGWRVRGRNYAESLTGASFTIEAGAVILAAGSINSTEILMRSATRGRLSLSPAVGTRFSCNGDFFGLAYNGDFVTQVTGFGFHTDAPGAQHPPGPAIVSAIHYNGTGDVADRFQIEDLTIPSAYVAAARRAFPLLTREDTDVGDEAEERRRIQRDVDAGVAYDLNGALNHTMFYLVMGFDDARGRMVLDTSWADRDGHVRVIWDEAGRQRIYTRLDEELRRHARALGASYIANPLWSFLDARHLITAHPIGGCPIGQDYQHGAVDEFGRVFAGDGSIHEGLFVADGALIPTSIGVNPFLTISALAEHIAERKVRQLSGEAYPAPPAVVAVPAVNALDVVGMEEAELERLFCERPTGTIDSIVNTGRREIDVANGVVRNDTRWKGFFPRGHVLNAMSAALFTGFQKRFSKDAAGRYVGVTSDSDGRIRANNTIEEIEIKDQDGGTEPGRYLLLRYTDPPWQGFYDLLKIVHPDVIVGRVYLGAFPHGVRLFTFVMTRVYRLDRMAIDDHRELFAQGSAPSSDDLNGAWRMDVLSNANQLRELAFLEFRPMPDGRLESRYQIAGLLEGLLAPRLLKDHFELHDFTPFHDEIRKVGSGTLVGKYVAQLPEGLAAIAPAGSLGLFHVEEAGRFGFYYVLTRVEERRLPTNTVLRPFLDVHLPDGLTLTFDEEMVGWYRPGAGEPTADRPAGAVDCGFKLRMTVRDLNEFIEAPAHEARPAGTIRFGELDGQSQVVRPVDQRSTFRYLTVNPDTREAELQYYLEFATERGKRFALDGRKYMQKNVAAGPDAAREVVADYTTLYGRVWELNGDERRQAGVAYLKFRTFEDLAAAGNLIDFVRSFQVTGTDDPLLRTQGLLRFMAFTAQFVQREYDPLALPLG